jgi:hypothetical protein
MEPETNTVTPPIVLSLPCMYFKRYFYTYAERATFNIFTDDTASLILDSGTTLFDCPLSEIKRIAALSSTVIITLTNGKRFAITADMDVEDHALQGILVGVSNLAAPKLGGAVGGSIGEGVAQAGTTITTTAYALNTSKRYHNLDTRLVLPILQYMYLKSVTVYRMSLPKFSGMFIVILVLSIVGVVLLLASSDIDPTFGSLLVLIPVLGSIAYPYLRTYR